MADVLLTIFWGVVLLSAIVVIHEGGHYLAARAFGVRVLEFMVGLPGPRVGFKRKHGTTRVGVTALPFGGYARIAGMDIWCDETNFPRAVAFLYKYGQIDECDLQQASRLLDFDLDESLKALAEWGTVEKVKLRGAERQRCGAYRYCAPQTGGFERGEPRAIDNLRAFVQHERSQTYLALPCWKRVLVCASGPLANLVTAIVVVTLVLSLVGTSVPTLTLAEVTEGGPAQQAGITAGDTITAVDGVPVDSWEGFRAALGGVEPGTQVAISYERGGEHATATLVTADDGTGQAVAGVMADVRQVRYAPIDAFGESIAYIGQVAVAVLSLINPFTAAQTISGSTSVVGISIVAKQAAELGWVSFIWLMAVLSISIGLMNLLPIMPLDGGRIVIEVIQRAIGKTLSPAALNAYTVLGMVFVFGLFFVVMAQDIGNLASGGLPL